MSNQNLTIWLTVVAIIAVMGCFFPVQLAPVAGGTRFLNGLSADGTQAIAGQVRGTTLAMTSTGSFATSSPSALGDVVISSAGTTTLMLGSSVASKGTCIQMLNTAGALESIFINGTTVTVVAGSCK